MTGEEMMGWYGVVQRVARGVDLKAYLKGECYPTRTVAVAKNEARRLLEAGEFTGSALRRVRSWLGIEPVFIDRGNAGAFCRECDSPEPHHAPACPHYYCICRTVNKGWAEQRTVKNPDCPVHSDNPTP